MTKRTTIVTMPTKITTQTEGGQTASTTSRSTWKPNSAATRNN